ncbi:PREDICTED: cytidine deaminase 1-like [Nicotiana attenuata]|uniref:cytidine deaminase n=1 Tax=Nicotiana attenuata TaxID=49451 RepID=A0A1J6IBA1_NICAT|nr:PREDICTED: cytidine deaminase 1-like [Nicotiana attenuata]OIT02301.1 cytidine deaminase 1 [Nicotiana attenuata]
MDQDQPKFVVEASEAESIAQKLGLSSVRHLLPALVQPAQTLARPPISNYHVGAVGLGSDGRVFLGVNLEFPGLPLHHSVHAEQFLLTNLAVHRCPRLVAFAVSAAPCGHCRQFLQELRNPSSLQIHITSQHQNNPDVVTFKPLSEILPNPFGPFDLLDDETPLLLERHNNGLSLFNDNHDGDLCNGFSDNDSRRVNGVANLSNGFCKKTETENTTLLKIAALEAANDSHAPYSGCPSGVALMDSEGKIYRGSYVESAAYNPSLGPVQAALVAYVAGGGGGYERIVAAALVEKEGAKVRQEDTARLFLKMVSPKCDLRVFHCSFAKNGCIKD